MSSEQILGSIKFSSSLEVKFVEGQDRMIIQQ